MGCGLGFKVGYKVRFEETDADATQIIFITGEALLWELITDPLLQRYSVIVVDLAHERTLHSEIVLAFLKLVSLSFNVLHFSLIIIHFISQMLFYFFLTGRTWAWRGWDMGGGINFTSQNLVLKYGFRKRSPFPAHPFLISS